MKKKSLSWLVVLVMILAMLPMQGYADDVKNEQTPELVSAETDTNGDIVTLTFNKDMAEPSGDVGSFRVKINGYSKYSGATSMSLPFTGAALNSDSKKIDIMMNSPLMRGDVITIDYTPGQVMAADGMTLGAITKYPVTNNIPVAIVSNLEGTWQAFDRVGNWIESAFPSPDNDLRGGSAYNRHIVVNGPAVTFYGYGIPPFVDFLYLPSDEAAAKEFSFNLDLISTDWHTLEGGGFLFNTEIDEGLMSGYCVLFSAPKTQGAAYLVKLFEFDEVDVNVLHNAGLGDNYLGLIANPGVTLLDTYDVFVPGTLHSISLDTSSNTISMWDGNAQLITNRNLPNVYGNGVGLIGSYISHNCSSLSYFTFNSLDIQGVADLFATLAGNQANLTFTAPEGATAVTVEQSTDGAVWAPATVTAQIKGTDTSTTVTGLAPKQTYYFRLVITDGKYAGYSRTATAQYIVGPITDLAAVTGDRIVNLTFTPPDGNLGLNVMQSTDGGVTWIPAVLANPINTTSTAATVTGLTNGQQYTFKIIVTMADETPSNSNVVNATPKVPTSDGHGGRGTTATVPAGLTTDHIAYIKGYPDNTVRPENNVTREEAAAVFYRLLDSTYRDTIKTLTSEFKDISSTRWSAKHIGTLVKGNIISGYPDGTFNPSGYITRAELAAMASRFDKLSIAQTNKFTDISGHWAADYINSAAEKGWINGYSDGTFKPDRYITRAEFVTLINNVLNRNVNTEGILSNAKQFTDLSKEMWYYTDMQEATNSHLYEMSKPNIEKWTKILVTTNEM